MSTARIPDGTPLGLVQVGLANHAGQAYPTRPDRADICLHETGRSDPPVKPTSEVAHRHA